MVFEFVRLVQLCDCVAVISLVAYLLTRTRFSKIFVAEKNSTISILLMAFTGGLLYLYGVFTGIEIGSYVISIQVIGPVIAGIIAGPASGFLAGLLGLGLQSLSGYPIDFEEFFVVLLSGIIGGGFWFLNKNRTMKIFHVFLLGCLIGFIQLFAGVRGVKPDFLDLGEMLEAILDLFIPTIAALCIFVFIINNLKNEEEKNRKSLHLEGELLAARQIQLGALPAQNKEFSLVSVAASLIPASYVGGDLYDYLELDDGSLYFALGDVSGKGVPASLLMSSTRMVLRSKVRETRDPSALIEEINRSFLEDGDCKQFITLIVGIIRPDSGDVLYCNAGHPAPFLIHSSGCEQLATEGNLPAGVMEDETFVPHQVTLKPGEVLLIVSDGVTEAGDESEFFGVERTIRILDKNSHKNPDDLVRALVDELETWTGDNPMSDDCTVLALGLKAS